METQNDVLRNPDSFMQIGDAVATSFSLTFTLLLAISLFVLVQMRRVPEQWRTPVTLGMVVTLISAIASFMRRDYWIVTQTNPVEFRFVDWVLTVPAMAIIFYYILRPLGANIWMLTRLFFGAVWMIGWGYIGESVWPESSFTWGIMGSAGMAVIIASIMADGYPKVFQNDINPTLQKGYLFLSLFLPLSWCIYPIGYMTVPGNIMEGALSANTVAIMYNLGDVLAKGGLAIGTLFLAIRVGERYFVDEEMLELPEHEA